MGQKINKEVAMPTKQLTWTRTLVAALVVAGTLTVNQGAARAQTKGASNYLVQELGNRTDLLQTFRTSVRIDGKHVYQQQKNVVRKYQDCTQSAVENGFDKVPDVYTKYYKGYSHCQGNVSDWTTDRSGGGYDVNGKKSAYYGYFDYVTDTKSDLPVVSYKNVTKYKWSPNPPTYTYREQVTSSPWDTLAVEGVGAVTEVLVSTYSVPVPSANTYAYSAALGQMVATSREDTYGRYRNDIRTFQLVGTAYGFVNTTQPTPDRFISSRYISGGGATVNTASATGGNRSLISAAAASSAGVQGSVSLGSYGNSTKVVTVANKKDRETNKAIKKDQIKGSTVKVDTAAIAAVATTTKAEVAAADFIFLNDQLAAAVAQASASGKVDDIKAVEALNAQVEALDTETDNSTNKMSSETKNKINKAKTKHHGYTNDVKELLKKLFK